MTEVEWLKSDDPVAMLEAYRIGRGMHGSIEASDRKLRLFAVACCVAGFSNWAKYVWQAELWADDGVERPIPGRDGGMPHAPAVLWCYNRDAAEASSRWAAARSVVLRSARAAILREIVGNPFLPISVFEVCDGGLRAACEAKDVAALIYKDRDFAALPILADAIEDGGCVSESLLAHLRSPGRHVRGCWALDLILGKA